MFTKFLFNIGQLMRRFGFDFKEIRNPAFFAMQKKLHELGGINFKIEFHPDGSWSAESINIDGIITGGNDIKKSGKIIKDAVFTYFEVPPYLVNFQSVTMNNEPVTMSQKVYATK